MSQDEVDKQLKNPTTIALLALMKVLEAKGLMDSHDFTAIHEDVKRICTGLGMFPLEYKATLALLEPLALGQCTCPACRLERGEAPINTDESIEVKSIEIGSWEDLDRADLPPEVRQEIENLLSEKFGPRPESGEIH